MIAATPRLDRGRIMLSGAADRLPRLSTRSAKETSMQWIDPAYCDIRLGFEVTAYVFVR